MDIFYERMKEIRKDADKNQTETAEALNITQQQYSLYESGKRYIPVDLLKSFCEYFQVSADYILGLAPDLDWPREERRKGRYNNDCTK